MPKASCSPLPSSAGSNRQKASGRLPRAAHTAAPAATGRLCRPLPCRRYTVCSQAAPPLHCFTFSIGKKTLAVNLYPAQKSGRDFEYAIYRGDRMRGLPNYVFQASHLQRRCYAVGKFRGAFRAKKSGVPLYLPMLLPALFVSTKILYEASKILAKKLLPFCHASKQKNRSFLVQSVRGMVFAGGLPPDYTQSKDSRKYYCESYQAFWEYAHPRLLQVQKIFRQRNLFRPGRG